MRVREKVPGHGTAAGKHIDVQKYFNTIQHNHLRDIVCQRVKVGVILRLINKWLKAGVWENGQIEYNTEGTPQGAVISPMLSNIYLNELLDQWCVRQVQPRLRGWGQTRMALT
jgi:retron-type reverse transcriptase